MSAEPDLLIHISHLELMVRIGVPDKERASVQRLTISLTLWPLRSGADMKDDSKTEGQLRRGLRGDKKVRAEPFRSADRDPRRCSREPLARGL